MFDIGWSELLVIGIIALLVIGPKELPQAFRTLGEWMRRARALAREFQGHVDELMRESQVEDMKREFNEMARPPEIDGLEDELMAGHTPKSTKKVDAPPPTDAPLREPPAP